MALSQKQTKLLLKTTQNSSRAEKKLKKYIDLIGEAILIMPMKYRHHVPLFSLLQRYNNPFIMTSSLYLEHIIPAGVIKSLNTGTTDSTVDCVSLAQHLLKIVQVCADSPADHLPFRNDVSYIRSVLVYWTGVGTIFCV